MSWAAHILMYLCRKKGCGGWSWELTCPFVQHPWKVLVFETCLSSHLTHWMREKILCGLRNLFILWIFDLYVCYALLILSLVWPITAEEQLGHLDTDVEEERKWSKLFTYFCKKYLHVAFWTEKTISTLRPRSVYFLHVPQQAQWQGQLEHALQSMQTLCTLHVLACPQKDMHRLSH